MTDPRTNDTEDNENWFYKDSSSQVMEKSQIEFTNDLNYSIPFLTSTKSTLCDRVLISSFDKKINKSNESHELDISVLYIDVEIYIYMYTYCQDLFFFPTSISFLVIYDIKCHTRIGSRYCAEKSLIHRTRYRLILNICSSLHFSRRFDMYHIFHTWLNFLIISLYKIYIYIYIYIYIFISKYWFIIFW